MYALTELISMFNKAGLRFVKAYGGFGGEPYNFKSDKCLVIAERIN